MEMENIMKKVLFAGAAATMLVAISPAFATSPAEDAEQGYAVYPPVSECHFVTQRIVTPNGHIVYERHQVCN
jgi:cytochrome c2